MFLSALHNSEQQAIEYIIMFLCICREDRFIKHAWDSEHLNPCEEVGWRANICLMLTTYRCALNINFSVLTMLKCKLQGFIDCKSSVCNTVME